MLYASGFNDTPPETMTATVGLVMLWAIETAMRASEICSMRRGDVHEKHVHIPETKNGHARNVPLSSEAKRLLKSYLPGRILFLASTPVNWTLCLEK
ncbi:MAG: tyrosine-type recombinase/integrase [Candidatus Thiodiazotropha sp. (ex Epidulcina cf. delphinae)]|nr:tyrosine-type recombinase/integrase [Candidatus Thiodiazotropha sp. (ex Epidulcina cf. delphinae)]